MIASTMSNPAVERDRELSAQVLYSASGQLEPDVAADPDEVQRMIAAGIAEMAQKGSVDPRVSDIVRRAGLSNKTFYRHFGSKDEFLGAILRKTLRLQSERLQRRLATEDRALDRVRMWVRELLTLAVHPELVAITRPLVVHQARLFSILGTEFWKSVDTLKTQLCDAIAEAVHAGELKQADPVADADAIYHLATGWLHARIVENLATTEKDVERIVDFAVRGLHR
jgi:AcrR family transcriptional regulator